MINNNFNDKDDIDGINLIEDKNVRRKSRKRRRIVSQILSYFFVLLVVAGLGFGLYKGIKLFVNAVNKEKNESIVSVSAEQLDYNEENVGIIATPDNLDEAVSEDLTDETLVENSDAVIMEDDQENEEARNYIDSLSLEQKVANLFIVSPEAITGVNTVTAAGDGTKEALSKYAVGGIVYSSKNVTNAESFKEIINNTRGYYSELHGTNLWVFVSEEGSANTIAGANTGIIVENAAMDIGNTGDNGNAYTSYKNIGTYLKEYGVDVDFAPICSVLTNESSYLANRCFSSDADIAASMVSMATDGLNEQGIVSCLVAFPGEGEATTDPSQGTCITEKSLDEMRKTEFLPFMAGIEEGAKMVMMSHITATNATGEDIPCSLSSFMINDILKSELGFDGIVISDDITKKAITSRYSAGEAAVMAINAGCDMIIVSSDWTEVYAAVLEAVSNGTISTERLDDALSNIYSVKFSD